MKYNLNTNKIYFLFYYITKKTKMAWIVSWYYLININDIILHDHYNSYIPISPSYAIYRI